MTLPEKLAQHTTIFIDTAPIIYYIEAHPQFGALAKADIAESAGKLRGKYPAIWAMDALQLAVALHVGADVFITNDVRLKRITEPVFPKMRLF